MGCTQSSAPASTPMPTAAPVADVEISKSPPKIILPEEAPMSGESGDEFKLTMATKVVKASAAPTPDTRPKPARSSIATANSSLVVPTVITGNVAVLQTKSNEWIISFAVLDRGVLVHCYPNDEDENNDIVSDPIKLGNYTVSRTPDSLVVTLRPQENGQGDTVVLEMDNEKDVQKWLSSLQAHIKYRTSLNEDITAPVNKEFGTSEVKRFRDSVQRHSVARGMGDVKSTRSPGCRVMSAHFQHSDLSFMNSEEDAVTISNTNANSLPIPPPRTHTTTTKVEANPGRMNLTREMSAEMDFHDMYSNNKDDDANHSLGQVAPRHVGPSSPTGHRKQAPLPLQREESAQLDMGGMYGSNDDDEDSNNTPHTTITQSSQGKHAKLALETDNEGSSREEGPCSPELGYDTYAYSSPRISTY